MTALFQLVAEYRSVAERLSDMDLDAQTCADTLEAMSGDLEVKAQNVAYMIMNLEATASAIKAHEEAQTARRKAIEARADSLRAYLQRCMEACGIEKIDGPGVHIGFRKSSAVVINEPGLIPALFVRTPPAPPPAPDKVAIGAAIKAGQEVPGAHIEHRRNLTIK
jgi:hypothetical protein